ncbi:MAG: ABC transporter ATP-binding protein [Alkalispirochaeta sp.]
MPDVASTRLKIENLTMRFPGVIAVNNASITVEPGEFFTLLGPSGCGKTTLLRTIAGFYRQSDGHIQFNDTRIDRIPAHRRDTGMVFQNYAVFPHLTVWQNVAYGLRARKIDKEEMDVRVKEALRLVDLEGYEARRPRQLSGGQQQRVVVARAIVIRPQILLMDEPLANLDAKLRVRLREELKELQQRLGITTIYVTHDQDEALSISDRVAVMSHGKIAQIGTPTGIYRHPVSRGVAEFVGEGTFFSGKVQEADDKGVTVAIDDGEVLHADPPEGLQLTEGDLVGIGFRPHDTRILADGEESENVLAGTVSQRMYFGGLVRYNLEMQQGTRLQAEEYAPSRDGRVTKGETIRISVPRDRMMVFSVDDSEKQS